MNEADRKWLEENGIEVFDLEATPNRFVWGPGDIQIVRPSMIDPKQDRGRRPFDPENDLMNPDGAF